VLDLQVEHNSEQEYKARNRKINPLDIFERSLIVADMVEDGVRSNNRRYYRSNSSSSQSVTSFHSANSTITDSPIESLRKVDPYFRVLRRSTNSDIGIRRSLQTTQPITDNEDGSAETSKRAVKNARPCYE
jgi:hypothetical protein